MESKVYTIDAALAQKNAQLKKKIVKSNEVIHQLRTICMAMIGIIIFLSISCVAQNVHINSLQNNCDYITEQYDYIVEQYTQLGIENTKLESALKNMELAGTYSNNKNNDNITVTDNLIQYSSSTSDFVYNPNIDLSKELQKYAYDKCQDVGIDYSVFLGLMYTESAFDPNAMSASNDYGLCQINSINHEWMKDVFGDDWDPMDPYDNISASLYILAKIANDYNCDNYHVLLMNYNMGHGNAIKCFNDGIYSSNYSRKVMEHAREFGYSGDETLYLQ